MSTYKNLPLCDLEGYEISRQSMTTPLHLDSPAIEIMANFSRHTALMLMDDMSIEQATNLLINAHMSKALVRNEHDQFIGMVTLADLQSSRVLSIANQLGVNRRDLTITNLMKPKDQCTGVQLQFVLTSTIGDVLQTLKTEGVQYLLVVAQNNMEIVGMISALDIAKSLHIPIQISPKPRNFQEVMLAVVHP
ncbi:CBS domain-containing protein [Paraglaciecola aquimarina]|uniref:CBS domain-containing protein n=1 Tax=Paraglaciecola algarum TaxID=3050085 RepID=A0ABS9D6X5_9ALTE|nr:CBS domain-containing protein [Paraglaciecola sp. G1-23]MCF2947574.1 CBS domain-containing protein [Paraglaciecola sp. G1-23]